jgi:hypothetical protein
MRCERKYVAEFAEIRPFSLTFIKFRVLLDTRKK